MKNIKILVIFAQLVLSFACASRSDKTSSYISEPAVQSAHTEKQSGIETRRSTQKLNGAVFFQTAAQLQSVVSETLKDRQNSIQKVNFSFSGRLDSATVVISHTAKKSLAFQYYGFFDKPNPVVASNTVKSSDVLFVLNSSFESSILSEQLFAEVIRVLNKIDENAPRQYINMIAAIRQNDTFSLEVSMKSKNTLVFVSFDQNGKIVNYRDLPNDENQAEQENDDTIKKSIPPPALNHSV